MVEILHTNESVDGEIESFLVLENGETTLKTATVENKLLYLEGMYEFLQQGATLALDDDIFVERRDDGYIMSVDGDIVHVPPRMHDDLLQLIYEVSNGKDKITELRELHTDVIGKQVRRDVINKLVHVFEEKKYDIVREVNGWLVEDMYLVDWNANIYYANENLDEGDYIRSGDGVVKTDTSKEAIGLRSPELETQSFTIGGEEIMLSAKELEFLSKVMWLLGRRKYHPDMDYWNYMDNLDRRYFE